MEIVVLHVLSILLYSSLLGFIALNRLKVDPVLLLAIFLTLFWFVQSIYNNLGNDSYYLNYYSILLSLYGWLLFLQTTYLKIPDSSQIKLFTVYGVNALLILIFVFQFRIDQILQSPYFEESTLFFAAFVMSIAMLFYLENIIRCLKSEFRYSFKHLLFALTALAIINLLNFYQLYSNKELNLLFHYLSLIIHVTIPVFLFISLIRNSKFDAAQFVPNEVGRLQYFLILIGGTLIITGIMQMFDFYFSQVRSDFYQSIFLMALISSFAMIFLSNSFRTEISLYLKSYFYGDRNDYKKEWEQVSEITRNDEGIYDKVMDYFKFRFGAQDCALYIYNYGEMKLMSSSSNRFDNKLLNINSLIDSAEKLSANVYAWQDQGDPSLSYFIITLNLQEDMIGLCYLNTQNKPGSIDVSSLQLCNIVSSEFAIRLWEIRHKEEIQRKDKLSAFNKTVAFLAHDLKNIIAQQKLALENFSKFRDDPEFLDDFNETIGHSTERLSDLVLQFRVSSLNSKKKSITISQLKEVIEQKIRLSDSEINFYYDHSGRSDIELNSEIITVVENLLKNAVEASQAHHPICISLLVDDQITIEVKDQGVGMTQGFIENKLFEPFNSTKQDEGLGVGMYHVKTILDEMGASIDVLSLKNEGTTITVKIPV